MRNTNYKQLGFKCGIEIHQQVAGKKLFCNCPCKIRKGNPDYKIVRKLRASVGEMGKVDLAAMHELQKGKDFLYGCYDDLTCLVETDSEPPHRVNKEALEVALQVALMLNAKIVDQIIFMRKTVIDGSNVSGFQRTALVGVGGFIEVNDKKINISCICLEEESAQVIKRTEKQDTYNLSRLGIPLIEIATDPDMTDPEEVREVASKIGMVLRSTDKMMRGIGSIRQDVNVSIKGGVRTEIKGFQDLRSIPKIIDYEIKRQLKEIKQGKKIEEAVRKAESDFTTSFLRPMPGAARMYPETDVRLITPNISKIKKAELLEDKITKVSKKFKLAYGLAKEIVKTDKGLFEELTKTTKIKPAFIAETLVSYKKEVVKKNKKADPSRIKEVDLKKLFNKLDQGILAKSSVVDLLIGISLGKKADYSRYEVKIPTNLGAEIKRIVDQNRDAQINALMGLIMAKYKGRLDGKTVMGILKKLVKT